MADVRLGIAHLAVQGKGRIVLAGHSFGRAVVIAAGAASPEVVAVAALSSQTSGTGAVGALSPRPLLLMHVTADEVLPAACSPHIHARARAEADRALSRLPARPGRVPRGARP